MTRPALIRPVTALLAMATLGGCGVVEDPNRFETMGREIAAIQLDGSSAESARPTSGRSRAEARGLRPAKVNVEVMDVHDFWDARDGVVPVVQAVAADASPAVVEAVVRQVADRPAQRQAQSQAQPQTAPARPVLRSADVQEQASLQSLLRPSTGLVQLGAYGSESAARAAWTRLAEGEAAWALAGLTPVYDVAEVNGRRLVRLRVQTPPSGAAAVCAAAGIDDPWCYRGA